MKSFHEGQTFYSIDVEASGPVPGLYNMLSFGATVILPDDEGRLSVGETIYCELRPVFAGHIAEANAIHQLDLQRLERDGLEPKTAMKMLTDFVERTKRPKTEAVFVGHVAVFDWMMIAWYYAWCGLSNPFGYKGIDTKSLAMGLLGVSWLETGKENMTEKLEVAPQPERTLHRADADAEHQAQIFCAMLNRLSAASDRTPS